MSRPSKYQESYPEELIKLMEQGSLDCEIFAHWGISKDTFYRWLNEYDDLKEAHAQGMAKCEAWWASKMRQSFMERDDKGFKYCIAIMNNKFNWEKGSKVGEGTTNTTNININQMNVLQNKSRNDLLDYIKTMVNKHSDIIDVKLVEEQPSIIDTGSQPAE